MFSLEAENEKFSMVMIRKISLDLDVRVFIYRIT
jgi:hypothetical protein